MSIIATNPNGEVTEESIPKTEHYIEKGYPDL